MSRLIQGRTFVSIAEYSEHVGCSNRTIRNYVTEGHFPAYRVHGVRGVMIDQAEADASLARLPKTVARAGVVAFGPKAKIITLAEVVQ